MSRTTRRALFLFATFGLLGCAAARTPIAIATALDLCLSDPRPRLRAQSGTALSIRCQCVRDAQARCLRAGLPKNCGWGGTQDQDHDSWVINNCLRREP